MNNTNIYDVCRDAFNKLKESELNFILAKEVYRKAQLQHESFVEAYDNSVDDVEAYERENFDIESDERLIEDIY